MSATPGKAYTAAYALWRRDAHRGNRLDETAILDTWPRVRPYYRAAAEVALLAAAKAPDGVELTAGQMERGRLRRTPPAPDELALEI